MRQDVVELVLRDAVRDGESMKAYRRRMKPVVIGMRQDARERSRASQRAGGRAEKCTVRVEPIHNERVALRYWGRDRRRSALASGWVGDVEWLVTPGGVQPCLNGYLILPDGHLWLTTGADGDDWTYALGEDEAPREYTFRRGNWVGIDGGHYNDVWDYAELRAAVKPWPRDWRLWEQYVPEHLRRGDVPWSTNWTIPVWTARVQEWARAASEAPR